MTYIIELLTAPLRLYPFITIPEIAYLVFFGMRFFGPLAVLAWPLYSAVLILFPVPTMAVVGCVIAVHVIFLLARNFIGDKIAGDKKAELDDGGNGVPRMTGHDKDIQDELDRMKQKDEDEKAER